MRCGDMHSTQLQRICNKLAQIQSELLNQYVRDYKLTSYRFQIECQKGNHTIKSEAAAPRPPIRTATGLQNTHVAVMLS